MADKKQEYIVYVDDNFHYMDESERYRLGEFDDYESALSACMELVDSFLLTAYAAGVTSADELYRQYTTYGEDPFIVPEDKDHPFSAWGYAKQRCQEICKETRKD